MARKALVYSLGPWTNRAVGVLLVPVYTRIFAPEVYGVIALMTATLALAKLGLALGVDSAVNRYYQDTDDPIERRRVATTGLVIRVAAASVFSMAVLPFAQPVSVLVFREDGYADVVQLALWALPFAIAFSYCQYLFRFNFRPWPYTFTSMGSLACNVSLTLWFILGLEMGLKGIYLAQLITAVSLSAATLWAVRGYLGLSISKAVIVRLMRFGLPLVPAALSLFIIQMSDRYFLVHFADLNEVGLYGIAFSVASVVALITAGFSPVWAPFVYSTFRQPGAPATFARVFDLYATAVLWMALLIGAFAVEILRLLTTEAYMAAYAVVPLLVGAAAVYAIGDYFPVGIGIAKKTGDKAWAGAAAAVTNIVLNAALIPGWGAMGAAGATLISYVVLAAVQMWRSQQHYFVPYRFARQVALWAVAAAAMGLAYAFQTLEITLTQVALKLMLLAAVAPVAFILGIMRWSDVAGAVRLTGSLTRRPSTQA